MHGHVPRHRYVDVDGHVRGHGHVDVHGHVHGHGYADVHGHVHGHVDGIIARQLDQRLMTEDTRLKAEVETCVQACV